MAVASRPGNIHIRQPSCATLTFYVPRVLLVPPRRRPHSRWPL